MIRYYGKPKDIGKKIQFELDDNKDYDFEIKEHRKKRSLNANAYAWELITQIAYVVGTTKEDVYETMLKRYGKGVLVEIKDGININGFFKYYDFKGKTNKGTNIYEVIKGSSEYDSLEMYHLLKGIESECNLLNIETLEDRELKRLAEEWGI